VHAEKDVASVAGLIRARLEAALSPERLEIVDLSARHAGHAGARPDGETHFALTVVSQAFAGRSRLERHRTVNDLLAALLRDRVHALSLTLLSPDEAGDSQRATS
jgi:BolA protein